MTTDSLEQAATDHVRQESEEPYFSPTPSPPSDSQNILGQEPRPHAPTYYLNSWLQAQEVKGENMYTVIHIVYSLECPFPKFYGGD